MRDPVQSLLLAMNKHDRATAAHQVRVGAIAGAIGAELGWSMRGSNRVAIAGAIHDMGKLFIPAQLLNKPGRLDPDELVAMRSHASYGKDIARHYGFDNEVVDIVAQHHERMDGSGYPLALEASHISPGAQVVAVADSLDAMVSHRPYQRGKTMDQAIEELLSMGGSRYAEDAVRACVKILRERGYDWLRHPGSSLEVINAA